MKQRNQFNSKLFLGKERIYKTTPSHPRISRVYVWNEARSQYDLPPHGKSYVAKRYELDLTGGRRRVAQYFDTLEEALNWQAGKEEIIPIPCQGTLFAEVLEDWRKRKLPQRAQATQIAYEKMLKLHFNGLLKVPMKEFNSKVVDRWIEDLKNPSGKAMQSKRRVAFDHELSLLSGILRFYREYHQDSFLNPIFHRHREDVQTGREQVRVERDIRYPDFQKFLTALNKEKNGHLFAALATVQYFQALRISEAAAIHWEDVSLHPEIPEASRLQVRRSVIWPRIKGTVSYVKLGFKNSKSNNGFKEQPLFPESYFAFKQMENETRKGLVFPLEGNHLEYRQIEYAYNKAFEKAGLPFRGTHIMRHGGTRLVYNATKDLEVAKQILGNRDLQTVQVYAQRDATALTQFAHERWKNFDNVVAIGRKR